MLHKFDPGWVRVGWEIETEVCDAGEAMMAPASHLSSEKLSGFVVRSRGAAVREIFARTGVDKDFGPVIFVGAGGFQVEFCKDVAVWLAPADERSARQALTSKQTAKPLGGFRGLRVTDTGARAASVVSQFIVDFADDLSEAGTNPLPAWRSRLRGARRRWSSPAR